MSDINRSGTGRVIIIPSKRRSIHSHPGCPFQSPNMNRYGLLENEENYSDNDQSVDETDGKVSSKTVIRRNSYHLYKKQLAEDNHDNDILSRSAPAKLSSQLYSSNISEDEQPSNLSFHSIETPNTSSHNGHFSHESTSPPRAFIQEDAVPVQISSSGTANSRNNINFIHTSIPQQTFTQEDGLPAPISPIVITVFSVICVLLTVRVNMLNNSDTSNTNITPSESLYDEFNFYTDISGIGDKYNVDEDSILQVQTGISTIYKKNDTGSFMFVYNSNTNNFNIVQFNKFMDDVSFTASKYLRNDSTSVHYILVESTKLDMKEHEELISRYRTDLHKTGVMLVRHVEDVPSDLAMAFHYYCDEYNPLVNKSAIFFTLNLAKCPQDSDNLSYHALIEKCLAKKWSSVPLKSIGPLLARVVSVVIDVTSVF